MPTTHRWLAVARDVQEMIDASVGTAESAARTERDNAVAMASSLELQLTELRARVGAKISAVTEAEAEREQDADALARASDISHAGWVEQRLAGAALRVKEIEAERDEAIAAAKVHADQAERARADAGAMEHRLRGLALALVAGRGDHHALAVEIICEGLGLAGS